MKKISLMIAALGASLAFTACQESADDHLTLGTTEGQVVDFLNVPEMTNMALQITSDNKSGFIHLTCSQPTEYGFAAPVNYEVEVSLSEDFTTPKVEGCPASMVLSTSFSNCAEINPTNEEIAYAMREILNVKNLDQLPTPYYKLYMRLIANISTTSGTVYPNTTLLSNTVTINQVSVAFMDAVGLPSGIFLRGGMNSWNADPSWEFVTTAKPGIYELNDVSIDAGVEFKIADAGWASINYGLGSEEFKLNEPYVLEYNAANIVMPADFSGNVQLTVSGGTYTVIFEGAQPDTPGMPTGVYVRGDFNSWGAESVSEFLTTDIKNVWVISNLTIDSGEFKVADANWGAYNLGGDGAITFGEPYALVPGGGNIAIGQPFVGEAKLTVKGGTHYLTLTPAE